ncbi:hypothetical protein CTM76_00525 [Photobacterium phosphoreum]|nr:hypothetical protein CTM76_00525 [Photobacterium phosphoreum]
MNFVIIFITIMLNNLIENKLGYSYNVFSDPFDIKLLLINIALYIIIYSALCFSYSKLKLIYAK